MDTQNTLSWKCCALYNEANCTLRNCYVCNRSSWVVNRSATLDADIAEIYNHREKVCNYNLLSYHLIVQCSDAIYVMYSKYYVFSYSYSCTFIFLTFCIVHYEYCIYLIMTVPRRFLFQSVFLGGQSRASSLSSKTGLRSNFYLYLLYNMTQK